MSAKTRFVCISDTHNKTPASGAFKLAKGDVLVHAGDFTNQGTIAEIRKALHWIEAADFEKKIVIAGNHDVALDQDSSVEQHRHTRDQSFTHPETCRRLFADYPSITFLNHESAQIRLVKETGPKTTFKVFGSPYSLAHGAWAFGYPPEAARAIWRQVPLDTDVLITHTPPHGHCDDSGAHGRAGCETLRKILWCVRPRLAICGHIHEGRGAQRVSWDLAPSSVGYGGVTSRTWVDPGQGNKKQSVIDLSRKGGEPLNYSADDSGDDQDRETFSHMQKCKGSGSWRSSEPVQSTLIQTSKTRSSSMACGNLQSPRSEVDSKVDSPENPTHSHGTCLSSRGGRKETCIINAAIMKSSWSPKAGHGGKYNKPIIVDIDLPLW